jgi:hypothetical protein
LCIGPAIDYQTVRDFDKALKVFKYDGTGCLDNVEFYDGAEHILRTGKSVSIEFGSSNSSDSLHAVIGTLINAIDWADQLERSMRDAGVEDWYSPHVVIRVSSVDQGEDIYRHLKPYLENAKKHGDLRGDGWGVVINHGRLKTRNPDGSPVPKEDRALGNPKAHSWFRAKHYLDGQCDDKCRRALILCDMGIRGTNNWCCAAAVDGTDDVSVVLHSQFTHSGRIGRWPPNRAYWHDNVDRYALMTPKIFIPKSSDSDEKRIALENTARWMFDMVDVIDNSGVPRWSDLLTSGASVGAANIPSGSPFTGDDALQIDVELSRLSESKPLEDFTYEDILNVVHHLPPEITPERLQAGIDHARSFIEDEDVRRRHETGADKDMRDHGALKIVEQETPKDADQFTTEDMVRFIKDRRTMMDAAAAAAAWESTPLDIQEILRQQNADRLKRSYMQVLPKSRKLHTCKVDGESRKGILDEMVVVLQAKWSKRRIFAESLEHFKMYAELKRSVNSAAKILFDMDNIDNDSALDTSMGHYKLMGIEGQRRMKKLVKKSLIESGLIKIV